MSIPTLNQSHNFFTTYMAQCEELYKFEKPKMEHHDNVSRVIKHVIVQLFERELPPPRAAKKEG